jgi:mono/diheme cytochrome c family protein
MAQQQGYGLWRWIAGGFAAGAVMLGFLVAAYAVGYDRGQDSAEPAGPAETTTDAGTTETTPGGDLVAAGEELWTSTGCGSCHTIDGGQSVGPTVKGLAGSTVALTGGESRTADDAYLALAITDPDAEIAEGYDKGVMSAAVAAQGFGDRPDDVEALVAYIQAQR